jgi:hypothetical protein
MRFSPNEVDETQRLTLTVTEAAYALGLSRAFAYELGGTPRPLNRTFVAPPAGLEPATHGLGNRRSIL